MTQLSPQVRHGLTVCLSLNVTPVVWLYAVGAHTQDIRARIPYLIALPGVWPPLLVGAMLFGMVGLLLTRGMGWRAASGVALGSVLILVVLVSGAIDTLIPVSYESPPRYWLVGIAVFASGVSLWNERRRYSQVRARDIVS